MPLFPSFVARLGVALSLAPAALAAQQPCGLPAIVPVTVENRSESYFPAPPACQSVRCGSGETTEAAAARVMGSANGGWQVAAVDAANRIVFFTRVNTTARDAQMQCLVSLLTDSVRTVREDVMRAVRAALVRPLTDEERRDFVESVVARVKTELAAPQRPALDAARLLGAPAPRTP